MKSLALVPFALFAATSVHAQEAATPACPVITPPAAFAALKTPVALAASADAATAPNAEVSTAYALSLSPSEKVVYPVAPYKAPPAGTFGGLLALKIATASIYSVALDQKAWIDITKDGQSLRSVAHQDGAPCSGVKKVVDFQLDPGLYGIQLAGVSVTTATLEVAPK